MSFEASKMPIEARIDQLMNRIDSIAPLEDSPALDGKSELQDFRATIAMMQAQMYGDAFGSNDDKSKNNMSMIAQNPMMMKYLTGFNQQMPFNLEAKQNETMVFPLKGRISSDYGKRSHPIHGHNHFHTGVDIAAQQGSAIRMPYSGTVSYVGHVDGFGDNTVIVAHENQRQPDGKILYSVFGHNENAFVRAGDRVNQGEIFATVGSDGHSTGPHLHWETRVAPQGTTGLDLFKRHISMTVDPMNLA